jgi:L-histidine N-alpha-methyltransferase
LSQQGRPAQAPTPPHRTAARLQIRTLRNFEAPDALAHDVRRGLCAAKKWLPPKYFYDARGSALFDAICDLPEYYLTRAEEKLLGERADEIINVARPAEILEFGSGSSRKTRLLLDAVGRAQLPMQYSPFDVSIAALQDSAHKLLVEYPSLSINALVGDYETDLGHVPTTRHRLVAFLGSTIGNFAPMAALRFLRSLHHLLHNGDYFLLGVDLVKPVATLEAAYNDRAGITAEFNRNVLHVINRELDADFEPQLFEHLALFNRDASQIEMHLRSMTAQTVRIGKLDLCIDFAEGETIHTEISRKFNRLEVARMLDNAGFTLVRWLVNQEKSFALALAQPIAIEAQFSEPS